MLYLVTKTELETLFSNVRGRKAVKDCRGPSCPPARISFQCFLLAKSVSHYEGEESGRFNSGFSSPLPARSTWGSFLAPSHEKFMGLLEGKPSKVWEPLMIAAPGYSHSLHSASSN